MSSTTSTLLLHLAGNRSFNRTIFRPHLYIYSDRLIFKKRHILSHEERTIAYNQVTQIHLKNFALFLSHLEIVTTGSDTVRSVTFVNKTYAKKAKKIIDQKVYEAHHNPQKDTAWKPQGHMSKLVHSYEIQVKRMDELLATGRITKKAYQKRQKDLLKKIH